MIFKPGGSFGSGLGLCFHCFPLYFLFKYSDFMIFKPGGSFGSRLVYFCSLISFIVPFKIYGFHNDVLGWEALRMIFKVGRIFSKDLNKVGRILMVGRPSSKD